MKTQANKNQLKVSGGTTGQALVKLSNADFDYDWGNVMGGGGSGGTKLALDLTSHGGASFSYTVTIPGGTIGTDDVIRYTLFSYNENIGPGDTVTVSTTYGGNALNSALLTNSITSGGIGGMSIQGYVAGNGATNAQTGYATLATQLYNGWEEANDVGTCATDSTVSQNLVVTVTIAGGGGCQCAGILVEKISSAGSNLPVTPAVQSFLFDDFIGGHSGNLVVGDVGELGWTVNNAGAVQPSAGDSAHPGIVRLDSNNSSASGLSLEGKVGALETASSTYEFMVQLGIATDDFEVGLSGAGNKYILIRKNGANWEGVFNGGGGETIVGSVAATTNWVKLNITTNGAGTSAEYFIDGVSIGTQAVTGTGGDMNIVISNNTTTPFLSQYIDYFYMNRVLTR